MLRAVLGLRLGLGGRGECYELNKPIFKISFLAAATVRKRTGVPEKNPEIMHGDRFTPGPFGEPLERLATVGKMSSCSAF